MPEIPILTTSERRAFKRCPQRWFWEYRQGLRAYETNDKLWFGIGIHLALAHMYGRLGTKRNLDYIDVWRAFCDEDEMSRAIRTRPFDEAEKAWVDAKALGEAMLLGHFERWGGDPQWDVIYVEEPFQILVPDPRDPEKDIVTFTSTFDGVVRDKSDREIKLLEHKTAAAISLAHLGMDDQGGAYWAVAQMILREKGILGPKQNITAIEYNFLKKSLPDNRPKDAEGYATNKPGKDDFIAALEAHKVEIPARASLAALADLARSEEIRVVGPRSSVQPGPLFVRETVTRTQRERATQVRRIQAEALAMEPFRSDPSLVYKNPTRDCSWDCPFVTMCELHDQGADYKEFRDAVFRVSDPYDRYRKSASEGV